MQSTIQRFEELVSDWDQLQGFIDKTLAKQGRFSESVIEKLVLEYTTKQEVVTEQVQTVTINMAEMLTEQRDGLATLKHNNSAYEEVQQELELRHEIGAISDEDYSNQIEELQSSMEDYTAQVESFESSIVVLETSLLKWETLSGNAVLPEESEVDVDENEEAVVEDVEVAAIIEIESESVDEDAFGDDDFQELPPIPEMEEAMSVVASLDEDLSFDDVHGASPFANIPGDDLNMEWSNDSLGYEESIDLSQELIEPDDLSGSIDLASYDLGQEAPSAMLIRDEGVVGNEAIFPFKGEEYKLGRAADNNIQIKDDNKVSRHHCKLVRRGNQFFIIDLGSSNGTLVNGENFDSEFKLFGGEELKVGETIFRFTIQ